MLLLLIKKYGYIEKKSDSLYESVVAHWAEEKFCVVNVVSSEVESNNEYLKEVSNIGEIIRYISNKNGLKNSQKVYEKILKK